MNSSRIDSLWTYWLIFRSRIDSYSYLPQFHFMNIIPICEYCNLTNNIPIQEYFSKYSWISYLNKNIYVEVSSAIQIFNIVGKMHLVNSGCLNMSNYIQKSWLNSSFLESLALLDSLLDPTENELSRSRNWKWNI